MHAIEQEREQLILSKELKEDKKLELSNVNKEGEEQFGKIIANSIQLIDIENLQGKLSALNKALKEPISYPNNYVFASLVEGIYKDDKKLYIGEDGQYLHGKVVYPKLGNWQLLTVGYDPDSMGYDSSLIKRVTSFAEGVLSGADRPNGYSGAAYWNPDTQQVIIVHSGTKNTGGWDADLCGVFLNEHVAQIDSAITFTDKIISVLKEVNKDKGSNIQLFITGHSLGAWLAPITAFSAKYLKKRGDYFVANPKFEETGYHASTVIFDGPGCEEMLRRIQRSIMNRYGPSFINSLDIVNYLSVPNVINTCNPQVGEAYRLFINLSQEDKKHLERLKNKGIVGELIESAKNWSIEKHIVVHTAATHKIVSIKGVFDPKTGEVLKDNGNLRIEKVEDWPLLISSNQKEEVRSKTLQSVKWGVKTAEILGKLAAKVIGATVRRTPIGLVIDGIEVTYGIYKSAYWYNELMQELNGFLKLADESNNYRLGKGLTCLGTGGREIRYETKYLNEDYKNERSLNAFTQPERKFLEEYKFLERYQEDLQGIVTLEELFDSLKDDKKLISDIMEMLKGCKVENGVIHSKNLQEFIPYIKRMLHLFPEMKQKVAGAYYKLPSNIHNKLYQLISSSYLNAIKGSLDFGRDNFGFKAFLEDSNLKILHTVQSCTSLGATRIYKTFNLVRNDYRDEKHHAFLNLDRVFYLGGEIFISFLKKIDYKYLLVIECDDVLNDKIKEFLEKLFSALEDNRNIKVILATEKGSDLSKFISESEYLVNNPSKCQEKEIEVKWNDLTADSQRKLLEKTVIFQGREVPLSAVINRDDNLDTIIDPETVVELFKNKKIEIGKPLPSLGETEGYYIERKLVKKVKVKEEVLKDDSLNDLFAVSNISKEELSRLAGGRKVRNFNEEDLDRFITLNENAEENAEGNFKNLCDGYSDCTIHWLERKNNGDLIWRKSHGKTLSGLRRYIENYESDLPDDAYSRNNTSIKMVNVNDISNFDERLIVVAAEPGMGKTTALTRFGTQKADGSSKWLIRMNLVEYKDKLEQEGFSDVDSVVKFLHENNIVSNTLAKKLLESRLNNSGNIVFLLDGFDEITSKGQTNVVNLIKKLQETKVEKVLISTRLHLRNELENSLSTVAYTLRPFSREDQAEFLEKFWQRDSGTDQGRLDNYINELLEFISNSIGDKERKFMGIPMQMRMVAEAFQEGLENQLNQQEPTFPENFDMLKLYDHFLYAKYRVYFGKRGAENIDLDKDGDWLTTKPTKVHRSLALKVLFPEMEKDFIGNNLPSEKDKQKVNQAGIAQCINDRVVFTHRTFAEYFVAGFLADKLSRGKNSKKHETIIEFLARELFESKNEVIKAFLDYRLAKHAAILKGKLGDMLLRGGTNVNVTDALGRSVVHYAAQEGHKEIVDTLLKKGADIRKPDELGKTALHYAARYNNGTEVVSYLLENAKDCINSKDKNGRTAVYYAAQQGNWDIVDFLIEEGASVDGLDKEKLLFHYTYKGSLKSIKNVVGKEKIDVAAIKDNHDNTLLHIAAQKGHLTVVELLLEKGADVGIANNSGKRPISYAAEKEHWSIVESLLRKKAKFNDLSSEQKLSLLDHSARNAHWDTVKLFMEDDGRDNYFGRLDGQQKVGLLCYTAENERWDIIEFLLRKGANFNDLNKEQKLLLLGYSAQNSGWDVVKLFMVGTNRDNYFGRLFDSLNDQQKTHCLYYFISIGDLYTTKSFIEKLIEKGKISDVNTLNDCGKTFLHLAAQDGKLNIVQYLVDEKGANLDAVTSSGSTPLHLAAKNGHLEVVKYLIDKEVDLTVKNTNGKTPKDLATEKGYTGIVKLLEQVQQDRLIDAAKQGDLSMVKKLIDQIAGSEVDYKLHWAVENGYTEVVRLLIEKGADFKEVDKDGMTPLHWAANEEKLEIVQYLIDKIAGFKVDYKLHWAAKNGYTEVVKLLIEKGANLNSEDNYGKTPLRLAAEEGALDVVKYLIEEKGADLNLKDNNGRTPLHLAAKEGNLDVVEYLVGKEADLNLKDSWGYTPLYWSVCYGKLDVAKYLIEKGADLNLKNEDGQTPLHLALQKPEWKVVELLIGKGADLNLKNKYGYTSLHRSAEYGELDVVKYLTEKGANLNLKDKCGKTPLHLAIKEGKLDVVKHLVEKGADLNLKDKDGQTPLHEAAYNGKLDVVKYLIENGADFKGDGYTGTTPLHEAVSGDKLDVVKYLVEEKGADLNSKNNYGETPLQSVFSYNEMPGICYDGLDVAKYLIEKGADLNLKDEDGQTPLHFAAKKGKLNVVKCLVKKGADLNSKNNYGETPLHLAIENNELEVAEYLIEKGANFNLKDNNGKTFLHKAVEDSDLNLVKLLIKKGADVNSKDNDGQTPLYLAAKEGCLEVVKFLLRKGADANIKNDYGERPSDIAMRFGNRSIQMELFSYERSDYEQSECVIQSTNFNKKQQEEFFHDISNADIRQVKQGLYLPSFEERNIKIDGKCTAITRSLSQALFLQSDKSFLSNLETSAVVYERIAQGKQISEGEEREVFALSKLLDNFERQLDSVTNSLPSNLIYTQGYKTLGDLSNYIAGIKGDFAIHLVTSNHVVAIYRTGDNYAYFDSNVAFVSGLRSIDQLMQVVKKGVESAGYKVEGKGFLLERFDVARTNNQLPDEDKQVLTKEIKTERQLLAEQDKEFGLIKINGQELSRVQLYDFGTKIHVEGSVPLLINADMNLNSKKFQYHLDKKEVSMTAREYLDSLKNSKNAEEATKFIPFIGSKREVEKAEQTRKPLLEQLVKGTINSILAAVSLVNISRSESQLPGKTDDKPKTCLNNPTVDNQLQKSL